MRNSHKNLVERPFAGPKRDYSEKRKNVNLHCSKPNCNGKPNCTFRICEITLQQTKLPCTIPKRALEYES